MIRYVESRRQDEKILPWILSVALAFCFERIGSG